MCYIGRNKVGVKLFIFLSTENQFLTVLIALNIILISILGCLNNKSDIEPHMKHENITFTDIFRSAGSSVTDISSKWPLMSTSSLPPSSNSNLEDPFSFLVSCSLQYTKSPKITWLKPASSVWPKLLIKTSYFGDNFRKKRMTLKASKQKPRKTTYHIFVLSCLRHGSTSSSDNRVCTWKVEHYLHKFQILDFNLKDNKLTKDSICTLRSLPLRASSLLIFPSTWSLHFEAHLMYGLN